MEIEKKIEQNAITGECDKIHIGIKNNNSGIEQDKWRIMSVVMMNTITSHLTIHGRMDRKKRSNSENAKKRTTEKTMNNEQETAQLRREIAGVATSFQLNNMSTSATSLC